MIEIKGEGKFETVPPIVQSIMEGDIDALEIYFLTSDINQNIKFGKYSSLSPLDIALRQNQVTSIEWLVAHGAGLNVKNNPSFLIAVRYCDEPVIRDLVEKGANTELLNNVKSDAFKEALYGNKLQNLPLIEELGHSVSKYGGAAFRSAVSDRNYGAMDFFINHGVDMNYNKPDQVYPFKPTPLCVAARYVDFPMVQYLVEHGADVTLAEKDGMRPYSIAVEKGDMEMAEYLKNLEPEEFHSLQNKLDELKRFKLPKSVCSFLQGDHLRLDLGEDSDVRYIDFFQLIDTIEMKIGRQKLLRVSKKVDNYSSIIVCWNPKAKSIAFYDEEHGELSNICPFEELIKDPTVYIQKYLNGEYSE